jgi:hypothetical protein
MPRVPRVTTKAGMLCRAISQPFSRPKARPTASAAAKPAATVSGTAVPPAIRSDMTQPPTMPARPRTAPTDKSIPPAMMTNVSPRASSSTSVAVDEVFSQFSLPKNSGDQRANPMMRAARTTPVQPSRSSQARRSAAFASARARAGVVSTASGTALTSPMAYWPPVSTGLALAPVM